MNLASRGLRDMDGGPESIAEAETLATVRRQARKVHLEAVAFGLVLAAVVALFP
ncbi:MAG: hypothetical protein JST54_28385 [Deltaproteobacteria bacterium]|nr:hypothetical protein [Deltaproteobacteria bacterium]